MTAEETPVAAPLSMDEYQKQLSRNARRASRKMTDVQRRLVSELKSITDYIHETATDFEAEGRAARGRGDSWQDCPYDEDSQAGRSWMRGWGA